jgi:hypothetical protein
VHKILASKYICENGKKKREKKKRKNFPANWAGGEFWPKRRQRERAGALSAHLAQPRGATAGERCCGAGPHARERGEGTALTARRGGKGLTEAGRRRAPQRFSAVGPVLWWGSGGGAWAVDGGHGGVANFACGGLWRPVHDMVEGARGGAAAGEVSGHNRVGEVACRDRESVAELLA